MKTDLCPRVTNLPPVAVVEQVFARPREPDVRAAVFREMHKIFPDSAPRLDQVVAEPEPLRFDAEGYLELDRYWGANR